MKTLKELFENANLPTDFANKASVLFESSLNEAVETRIKAEVKRIQEAAEENLEKAKKAYIEESDEDVEKFLDKQVKEWATANTAALTGSIKASIAESLLAKFKAVLESEGIEMPDEKEKAIKEAEDKEKELTEEIEDLKKELDESKARIVSFTKSAIIAEATKGMSKVTASRIASLSENIMFKNVRQFSGAVATITEGVGGKKLKIKEDADKSVAGPDAASKFPATDDNSNAAGADKNKAAVDVNTKVNEDAEAASKFPATDDNSNASGADKNKAAVEPNASVTEDSDSKYFQTDDDQDPDKDTSGGKKVVKEDAGVDNTTVNPKGEGDPKQEPTKVTEAFDIVALTLKSMRG